MRPVSFLASHLPTPICEGVTPDVQLCGFLFAVGCYERSSWARWTSSARELCVRPSTLYATHNRLRSLLACSLWPDTTNHRRSLALRLLAARKLREPSGTPVSASALFERTWCRGCRPRFAPYREYCTDRFPQCLWRSGSIAKMFLWAVCRDFYFNSAVCNCGHQLLTREDRCQDANCGFLSGFYFTHTRAPFFLSRL